MPSLVDNANVVNRPKDKQNNSEQSPSREQIASLAHHFCRERGQGDGQAEEDWIRAEKQLTDSAP